MTDNGKIETSSPAFLGGYSEPNGTYVPDKFFDHDMAHLTGAEALVMLYIFRRTYGFKKDADSISLNQICKGIKKANGEVLDEGTGLARSTAQTALATLEARGMIRSESQTGPKGNSLPTTYSPCGGGVARKSGEGGARKSGGGVPIIGIPPAENRTRVARKSGQGVYRLSGPQGTVPTRNSQQHTDLQDDLHSAAAAATTGDRDARTRAAAPPAEEPKLARHLWNQEEDPR